MNRKRKASDNGDVSVLPLKKRGRKVLLGEEIDTKVQAYLKKVREKGGVVSAVIAISAAWGIVLSYDRSMLAEFGGHVQLGKPWAYSLLK